jgi:hypothetical protein
VIDGAINEARNGGKVAAVEKKSAPHGRIQARKRRGGAGQIRGGQS